MLDKQRSEEEVVKQPTLQVMEARTTEETKVVSGVSKVLRLPCFASSSRMLRVS